MENYIPLGKLEVYRTAVKISEKSWAIYEKLDWQTKKIMGDQWIEATDSMGANVAEGYGRFHYLDRIKFYYNSRGSLFETKHWLFLLKERGRMSKNEFDDLLTELEKFHIQLNQFIKSSYQEKNKIS